jgi:DNA-binding HxlR family transcriptional regulator
MTRTQKNVYLWKRGDMKCCPIDTTFKLVGKKFTILIIREMMQDKTRFNQFLDSIEGINPKILSARLKEMERSGLIKRKVYSAETPVRIGYFLTEKGSALRSILDQMALFSMRYCAKELLPGRASRDRSRALETGLTTNILKRVS